MGDIRSFYVAIVPNACRVTWKYSREYSNWHHQYDCLDMSLHSGLDLLGGLKQLRVLSAMRMVMLIGVEEVRWMAESWPILEAIKGLNADEEELEADKWIKTNSRRIRSEPCIHRR